MAKKKSVYLNMKNIREDIEDICAQLWDKFDVSELEELNNMDRCKVTVDGKEAILDFYHKKDGTVSIVSRGKCKDISDIIKGKIEDGCEYSSDLENSSHSFKKISTEWSTKLIDYLTEISLKDIETNRYEDPAHNYYKFTGHSGDSLVVNIYDNGTITLQGRPAYLYSSALSFLSFSDDISMVDIVESVNDAYKIDIKTSDVRYELKNMLPNAYPNLDETILKILSPSISLKKIDIPLEDYSCYAFPALRALEAYMKSLLGGENIIVGNTFGGIFSHGQMINYNNDIVFKQELESMYNFYKNNRHFIFHADQTLSTTYLLKSKSEADLIVNKVIDMIETSYKNIHRII